MKIQNKFLAFFLIFLLSLIATIFVNASQQQNKIEKIHKIRVSEFSKFFQEIVNLKVSNISLFSYDYSYWDETVHFMETHDQQWAQINLDQALLTYGAEYIYVYDQKNVLLYEQYDRNKYSSIVSLINLKKLDFKKPIFINYFIVSNGNPIQLFIAPIQYSSDLNRTGKPHGYVIVGKVWSPEFVRDFEKITQQSITLKPLNVIEKGNYDIIYPLKDEHDKALYALGINLTTTANDTLQGILRSSLISIIVISMLGIGLLGWVMYRMIVIPLRQISRAMELNNEVPLNLLVNKKGEFAQIARLIKSFFAQREEMCQINSLLEHKIKERTRELEEINKTLDERVHTEIEKRRKQEQILIQQSRLAALGEMIGNIAHQWRQPLNTLGLIVQDSQEAYSFGEINEQYIMNMSSRAMEQINYMSQTIDDFRNFFTPDKDKNFFSLSQSILDTIDHFFPEINKHGIICQTTVDEDLIVYGFKNEFSQVLLNLLRNAQDALLENNSKDPCIIISAKSDDTKIELSIADNAGGVSDAIIDRIFEPYFTNKEEGKGTGLGLYMSKMIIEEHMDGQLSVKNNEHGAIFTILLNLAEDKQKELDHGV